jgi:Tfp pilus assembly major pilin PilA
MVLVAVVILAAIAVPAYDGYASRSKVFTAVNEGANYESDAAFAQTAGEDRVMPATSPYAKTVTLRPRARSIVVALNTERIGETSIPAGAEIVFVMGGQGSTEPAWICRGKGVPDKFLPAPCRQGAPP